MVEGETGREDLARIFHQSHRHEGRFKSRPPNLQILNAAKEELNEAVAYYEAIEPGLGTRLKDEVRAAIQWIDVNPGVPRIRPMGYRRLRESTLR